MPRYLSDILIFILVNALGYFSAHICLVVGTSTGLIQETDPAITLVRAIVATWLVCGAFSFASFFYQGKIKWVFLAAPAVIPLAYGLSTLLLL